MSENNRINHAGKAKVWIENAVNAQASNWEGSEILAGAYAGIAQAHATLALVEQQRIANLIALGQAKSAGGSFICAEIIAHPVDEWRVAVNDDIREGLGL